MKEINMSCLQCSHYDVCCHTEEMKKLDELLKEIDVNLPYAKINVVCGKFSTKEQLFKRG